MIRLSVFREKLKAFPCAALLPVAIAMASLLPYALGRAYILMPVLGLMSVVAALTLSWPRRLGLRELITLCAGLYFTAILAQLLFVMPQLATLGNLKGWVSLCLGWSVFVALTHMTQSMQNLRWIERSLAVLTLVLGGQIWVSYLTGWGEIYDTRDGVRRAFGMAGDNLTLVLVFLILWAFVRQKWAMGTLALSALMMTGGRLSLAVLILCFTALVVALPRTSQPLRRLTVGAFVLALLFSIGAVQAGRWMTLPMSPSGVTVASHQEQTQAPVSFVQPSVPVFVPPTDPDDVQGPKPFWQRMSNLYGASALGTLRGRLISVGAGYDMFCRAPLTGVGFGQSTALFQGAAQADRLSLKTWAGAVEGHFLVEKFIANHYFLTAAEQGLMGLLPFLAFTVCGLLICMKAYRALYHHAALSAPRQALALAGCLWAGSLIVAGQTVSWFLPASPQALWFGFALGLATFALPPDTSDKV